MSVVPASDAACPLTVVLPDEAVERSLPIPGVDELGIEGLTDEEWEAFERALADR